MAFHTAIELDRPRTQRTNHNAHAYRRRLQLGNSKSKWAVHEMVLGCGLSIALRLSIAL